MLPATPRGALARFLPLLFAVPGAVAATNCATAFDSRPNAEQTETFSEPFPAGDLLDLRNVNGRVIITGWDRDEAELVARKWGRSESGLREIEIEVDRTRDGLRVRTRYPKRGRMWGQKYGSVDYTIRLPERADLRIETVNGPVEVSGITGVIEAQTVNGSLRFREQRGSVNAKTVNGRIECELDGFGEGEAHSFRTVNGRVDLTIAGAANGEVDASAVNGRVVLDLGDSEHLATPTRRKKRVRLGEGGGECRVRTVNGAIHILAADD